MKHLDLFSGIGGFALAAQWAGFETVAFCEIEEYPRRVLQKNFPGVPIHHDIRELDGKQYESVDLITGGFPCQPYSPAGKMRGHEDKRDMLPEFIRVIGEARPSWVVGENSFNVIKMAFPKIKAQLESFGYEVAPPLIIPACGVNADHRRKRAWICAYSNNVGLQRRSEKEIQRESALQEQSTGIFPSERSRSAISEPGNLRSYYGVPGGVDRIRALGNAIVPQVAYEILRHLTCAV